MPLMLSGMMMNIDSRFLYALQIRCEKMEELKTMRKRKIMSSIGLPEFYYDEEFWVRTRDGIKIDCVVEDADMLDSDTMELRIYADASDKFVSEVQLKILIEMWFENQCDMCGVDYSVDVTRVNKYFDYDLDEYSGVCVGFNVRVEISDNQNGDSYFNASRKLGKKTIKSSKYVRCSSSYDTKLIAKYLKEIFDHDASGRGMGSFGNISDAEKYMNRNNLSYDSRNKVVVYRDPRTKETTTIFKVTPQYSNTKRNGMYAPKTPILEPVDSCDSVMSSYNPYGTDFKWYDEPIVIYIDGENITFRKYTGDYKGNIVVVQPEYNERTDVLSWVVYLNDRKLESFETSYDALDFAQFELVDRYITPIRSSRRVSRRKIVSAIDLRRKQDFVDAYMAAYGVTKTEALKAFKDCVNRGDESYIDEIIRGFKGNSRKSFYED